MIRKPSIGIWGGRMWRNRDVISILDFSREDLEHLFRIADRMDVEPPSDLLKGKIVALAFFEPSTRTRLSFESAVKRLGGSTVDLVSSASSLAKGESLADTFRMLDSYSNLIVVRSPLEGTAKLGAEICVHPIINGGDGIQHHPTQAMIDLYSIRRFKGGVDGLNIGVLGDLKYGRAATSFIYGLTRYSPSKVWLISPSELRIREEVRMTLKALGLRFTETEELEEAMPNLDVLYVTRIQRERFPDPAEYERVKGSYRVRVSMLRDAKDDMIILHPLPRIDELPYEVDSTPHAKYFEQARLGVPLRMALISLVLGVIEDD